MISPLTRSESKLVPNTPYYEDPVSGLWFQERDRFTFSDKPPAATYSDAEGIANVQLLTAILKHMKGKNLSEVKALDLGAVYLALADAWKHAKVGSVQAAADLLGLYETGEFDVISMVHSFQRVPAPRALDVLKNLRKSVKNQGLVFLRMPDRKVKGFERDLTPQHYEVSNCIWTLDSFLELLAQVGTFKIIETYEIQPGQRDYFLRAIESPPTICIGMIAKNEERDLPKCLQSIEGIGDGLCFIDTGSTDHTMDIAKFWAERQDGTFKERSTFEVYTGASEKDESGDWKLWNFSQARNQYVEKIDQQKFDWVLWMDADDTITNARRLSNYRYLDQYPVQGFGIRSGGLEWAHHRMWKTGLGIKYMGRCHEYPHFGGNPSIVHEGILIEHQADPIPGMENSNPRNLRIMQREFAEEPTPRCAFYLANTYKDCGRNREAAETYQKRIDYGYGYAEEYFFAVLYKGRCERLDKQFDAARRTLLKGATEHPEWAEFWMELYHLEVAQKNYWRAIGYALQAKDLPVAPSTLFREANQYTDQPYRMISWAFEYMGLKQLAYEFALEARDKIGSLDKDWEDRITRLEQALDTPAVSAPKPQVTRKKPIVLHRPGALGDVIMTLNHLPALKRKYPHNPIYYRTHEGTKRQLESLMKWMGVAEVITTPVESEREINLVGYPLSEGYPDKPMKRHLLEYFADEMGVECDFNAFKLIQLNNPLGEREPYVTIHTTAGWSMYKNWIHERWEQVVMELNRLKIPVVQIGGPGERPVRGAEYQCGLLFSESLLVQAHAKLHVGIDSWSNHSTNIQWDGKGRTPGVILWGSTQHQAAGYPTNMNISAGLPCQPCFREDPKISAAPRGVCPNPGGQTYESPRHECMSRISVESVLKTILFQWGKSS